MKRLLVVLTSLLTMVGCSGFQLTGDANNQALAYLAGKGTAIGVYKLYPKVAPSIESEWMMMMGRNADKTEIQPQELMNFFNGVVLQQVPNIKDDKYGFAGDLKFFLALYGAQYTPEGVLTGLQPVPMVVARAFQIGYEGGRSVAQNLK